MSSLRKSSLTTNDKTLAEKTYLIREYGWKERYISYIEGHNSRLDEIQAAVLRIKLKYLSKDNKKRKKIAEIFRKAQPDRPVVVLDSKILSQKELQKYYNLMEQPIQHQRI